MKAAATQQIHFTPWHLRDRARSFRRDLAKTVQSNFFYSFLFLPGPKRDAIIDVYGFCRAVDDVVDEIAERANAGESGSAEHAAIAELVKWRKEVESLFVGNPTLPITRKLQQVLRQFPMPKEYFVAMIEGCEMDLYKNRYETFEELRGYCYRVASITGLMCIEIFTYQSPQTRDYAINLGLALQLTNILRDLKEDAARGRIYVPQEDLRFFGYSEDDLMRGRINDDFRALMRFQCDRARMYYRRADELLPEEDRPTLTAALTMGRIYYRLLEEIERVDYDVFNHQIRLHRPERFLIALDQWVRARQGDRETGGQGDQGIRGQGDKETRGQGDQETRGQGDQATGENTMNSPAPLVSLSPCPLVPFSRLPVVIIGGGFAGLAAAVDLSEAGTRVLLLERRAFLGGRAYSFTDKTTGDVIDNGQHLMMGCYHATLAFLEKIGASHKLKLQSNPRVDFLHEREGAASFRCPPLPAPLHLLAGLARLETIGWRERIGALRVGLALKRLNGDRAQLAGITVRQWLTRLGQSERIQRRFWDVMALATLNESPAVASADMFARVLDRAFLHSKRDSAMVISKVGLSDLYTEDARRFIEARGGEVRLNAEVEEIEFAGDRACGVRLRDGERIDADAVISAAPCFALRRMLAPDVIASNDCFRNLDAFKSSPIVSVNLWYDEPVTDLEFVGLLDSGIEWVFNKNAIAGRVSSPTVREGPDHYGRAADTTLSGRQHLALVISGAHHAARLSKEELIAMAAGEMRRFFPAARRQHPVHAFVVREHDATISHTVGLARLRPPQRTRFENFYLAGDWTATGLPATIEGAVWSGQECAREVMG